MRLSYVRNVDTAPLCAQAFAGIVTVSVGHCHPHVLEAVNKQNKLLQHTTTIYLNPQVAQFAKELADKMPGNLKVSCNESVSFHFLVQLVICEC